MIKIIRIIVLLLAILSFSSKNAFCEISLIRDAEIEDFIYNLQKPILEAAGINPSDINIYIVQDTTLNAFVMGGQNVFVNTGLIRKFNTPDTLIGVLAHEIGHISGGHIARSTEGSQGAKNAMLLSYLLGIGAFAAGQPDVGSALIMGGSNSAGRLYQKYSRDQEEVADQYALKYLQKINYPPDGLLSLLQEFDKQMIGYKGQIDEYLLSHPVSSKRIELIKARRPSILATNKKINNKLQAQMDMVLDKLEGFIDDPVKILEKYQNLNDERAKYVKSIAYMQKGNITESIALINSVIEREELKPSKTYSKKIGFLYELKGQINFEGGKINDSIKSYEKSLTILRDKNSVLANIAYASSILTQKDPDSYQIDQAISSLEKAKIYEPENLLLHNRLALAYFKNGQQGKYYLALAQFNLIKGEDEKALEFAKKAKELFSQQNPSHKTDILKADDIIYFSKLTKVKQ